MDEKKLPLTAHLQELRKRLILSFIAIGVGFFVCYALKEPLFDVLAAPLIKMMPAGGSLIFTSVAEAFFTYMKVAFIAGIILTSPYVRIKKKRDMSSLLSSVVHSSLLWEFSLDILLPFPSVLSFS
jgi:Sec-independent protein secretion pathway component TatC